MKHNVALACITTAIITISLVIELSQFFYIDKVCIPLLTSFYYALINHNASAITISSCFIAQMLQSFCCYGSLYLPMIHIVPLTVTNIYAQRFFYPSFFYSPYIALIAGFIMIFIEEKALLELNPTPNYTIIKMSAILIGNIFFSLIIRNWGVLDNRSSK